MQTLARYFIALLFALLFQLIPESLLTEVEISPRYSSSQHLLPAADPGPIMSPILCADAEVAPAPLIRPSSLPEVNNPCS